MTVNIAKARQFMKRSDREVSEMCHTSRILSNPDVYSEIEENLRRIAQRALPDFTITVSIFGSRGMGLGTHKSDVDTFIGINGTYNSSRPEKSPDHDKHFRILASAFAKSGFWFVKKKLLKTDVPIIIMTDQTNQINCDVSILNGFSVENTKLIGYLLKIQPQAVPIHHYIRKWMNVHGFELKGYTITLLLLFFLQVKELMPSIKDVQAKMPKKIISGWEVQFNPHRSLEHYGIKEISDYKPLAMEFFKFYAAFGFKNVISPYHAKVMEPSYFTKCYPQFVPMGLNVAGPCNKKNCGKVAEGVREQFIEFCKASSSFFQNNSNKFFQKKKKFDSNP